MIFFWAWLKMNWHGLRTFHQTATGAHYDVNKRRFVTTWMACIHCDRIFYGDIP